MNLASTEPIISASLPRYPMAEASVTHYAAATASAVYGRHPPSLDVQGVPILVPRDEASSGVDRTFLAHLTQSAASVASSLACGSVLAGTTSETDEYGDVAFWLGEGEFGLGREHDIFDALGLKSRITQESKVSMQVQGWQNCIAMTWFAYGAGTLASLS